MNLVNKKLLWGLSSIFLMAVFCLPEKSSADVVRFQLDHSVEYATGLGANGQTLGNGLTGVVGNIDFYTAYTGVSGTMRVELYCFTDNTYAPERECAGTTGSYEAYATSSVQALTTTKTYFSLPVYRYGSSVEYQSGYYYAIYINGGAGAMDVFGASSGTSYLQGNCFMYTISTTTVCSTVGDMYFKINTSPVPFEITYPSNGFYSSPDFDPVTKRDKYQLPDQQIQKLQYLMCTSI